MPHKFTPKTYRKQHRWTKEETDAVIASWGKVTLGQMSIQLGVTIDQLSSLGRRLNLGHSRIVKFNRDKLIEMHSQGATEAAMCATFNVCTETIRQWLVHLKLRKSTPRRPKQLPPVSKSVTPNQTGWNRDQYTDEESEFLHAIEVFRYEHKRVPTLIEGLRIAKELGWIKEA